jgi:hypothetical protein
MSDLVGEAGVLGRAVGAFGPAKERRKANPIQSLCQGARMS